MDIKQKTKRIVICADDFGMNSDINAGILYLAQVGRLNATSCLVQGPAFTADASALKASGLQIGLHLNFTEPLGQSGLHLPLSKLIKQAYLYRLDVAQVRQEIVNQLDLFDATIGRPPDFVDGHQHIHQLPQIRTELLFELTRRYRTALPWLRNTKVRSQSAVPLQVRFKAYVIQLLGAARLGQLARRDGFALNSRFLGVYGFNGGQAGYQVLLGKWLNCAHDGDLLMCHPAKRVNTSDALGVARVAEFDVLSSPQTGRWLKEFNLIL